MSSTAGRVATKGGIEPLKREKLARTMARLAREAPDSLAAHAALFHRTAETNSPLVPAAHHLEWVKVLQARDAFRWVVIVAPPGYAKALHDDEPVLTTEGWKRHGDIEEGDHVFAPDGHPVRVLGTRRWEETRPCYRVTFSDGSSIVADERHDWFVLCDRESNRKWDSHTKKNGRPNRVPEIIETRDLLKGQRRPPAIPVPSPLEMDDRDLPIDPYVLGLWLGDGRKQGGMITVGDRDPDLLAVGSPHRYKSGSQEVQIDGLTTALRQANLLHNKHIPEDYFLGSFDQRLALLQGLMDSDGTVSAVGQCSFSNTNKRLAGEVRSLVASLGMKASMTDEPARLNGREVGRVHRVIFHATKETPCFRLARKRERLAEEVVARTRTRYVTAVEFAGDLPAKCISVEGELYLAGTQLIPTHNSKWISQAYVAWRLGVTKGRSRIGLIAKSAALAANNGNAVAAAIEDPRYERVYGIAPDMKAGWSQEQMWTTGSTDKTNPNLACVGLGGYVQGRRFDEIILDDPSDQWDVLSDTVMNNQRNFIKGTLLERFAPGLRPPDGEGRMVVVMTRWGERDLLAMFRDMGFKIVHMPAIGYWDKRAVCPGCHKDRKADTFSLLRRCEHCGSGETPEMVFGESALWPEMEPISHLEKMREEDPTFFDLVYQGDPRALAGDIFEVGKLNFAPVPEFRSFENIIQFVDTAGGKDRKKGDFFCQLTMGLRKQGQEVWILDVDRGRYAAPEQYDRVKENFRLWQGRTGVNAVVIEVKNEGNALYQNMIIDSEARLPLRQFTPVADKEWRARPFANVVNAGRVWLPSSKDGERPVWARSFVTELDAFPNGSNDDQVDAASGAYGHTSAAAPRIRVLRRGN